VAVLVIITTTLHLEPLLVGNGMVVISKRLVQQSRLSVVLTHRIK